MKDLCLLTNPMSLIYDEHYRQLKKWGVQDRTPFQWLAFATEELGETSNAMSDWYFRGGSAEAVVKEAIQTATLCIKIAEMFRNNPLRSE